MYQKHYHEITTGIDTVVTDDPTCFEIEKITHTQGWHTLPYHNVSNSAAQLLAL
jgi:hypothetical protein